MGTVTPRRLRRFKVGDPLRAARFNEHIDATQALLGQVDPPREARGDGDALRADEEDPDGRTGVDEVWSFLSKVTRTERIEDADDSEVFIDVEITESVTVRRPDGLVIRIELEEPTNG